MKYEVLEHSEGKFIFHYRGAFKLKAKGEVGRFSRSIWEPIFERRKERLISSQKEKIDYETNLLSQRIIVSALTCSCIQLGTAATLVPKFYGDSAETILK